VLVFRRAVPTLLQQFVGELADQVRTSGRLLEIHTDRSEGLGQVVPVLLLGSSALLHGAYTNKVPCPCQQGIVSVEIKKCPVRAGQIFHRLYIGLVQFAFFLADTELQPHVAYVKYGGDQRQEPGAGLSLTGRTLQQVEYVLLLDLLFGAGNKDGVTL
jgi:hypothetical protein